MTLTQCLAQRQPRYGVLALLLQVLIGSCPCCCCVPASCAITTRAPRSTPCFPTWQLCCNICMTAMLLRNLHVTLNYMAVVHLQEAIFEDTKHLVRSALDGECHFHPHMQQHCSIPGPSNCSILCMGYVHCAVACAQHAALCVRRYVH